MACLLHGLAHYQNRSQSLPNLTADPQAPPKAAAAQREAPLEADHNAGLKPAASLAAAGAVAASPKVASKTVGQLQPPRRRHRAAGDFLPYACSEVSSVRSGWRYEAKVDPEGSLLTQGLLKHDISRAQETTPGVCVLRQLDLPRVQSAAGQNFRVKQVQKQLQRTIAKDQRARIAFQEKRDRLVAGEGYNDGRGSSETLPRQQELTAGKPALCRPIDGIANLPSALHAEDSYFTSEYRANGWWKMVFPEQRHELKEHVRPYDNFTLFRDTAVKQALGMRAPIRTY
mmetsp:Transcript_1848/g.2476  ORF Transcript_1848/g.2476 Transcript_1848/m.2476 type:complete len:286 (-) Transcript_1848:147-1004(-)